MAKKYNSVLPNTLNGRTKIEIPYTADELNGNVLNEVLPKVLATHYNNASISRQLINYVKGTQDIIQKGRLNKNKANNVIVENHAFGIVNFKTGLQLSEPIKYASAESSMCPEEISLLNRYMRLNKKDSLDTEMGEILYSCGVATRVVVPSNGSALRSPFEIYNLQPEEGFICYSSKFKKEKLFGGIVTTDEFGNRQVDIYTRDYIYHYDSEIGINATSIKPNPCGCVNFNEYTINSFRMGCIDIVKGLLDAVNLVTSNSLDNLVDYVNSLLAVYNMEMTLEQKELIDQMNSIVLKTNDPNKPADAKYIVNSIDFGATSVFYENLIKIMYDLVGVPRGSQQVSSGGDTGQARMLGGGWTKAVQVAKQEEKFIKGGEIDLLEIALKICHEDTKLSKIKTLYPEDLEVHLNRVAYDNLLVATQSMTNLYQIGMPEELILQIVNVVPDVHEASKLWQENIKLKQQQTEFVSNVEDTDNVISKED